MTELSGALVLVQLYLIVCGFSRRPWPRWLPFAWVVTCGAMVVIDAWRHRATGLAFYLVMFVVWSHLALRERAKEHASP
jgi:hypothetical protein